MGKHINEHILTIIGGIELIFTDYVISVLTLNHLQEHITATSGDKTESWLDNEYKHYHHSRYIFGGEFSDSYNDSFLFGSYVFDIPGE